MQRRLPLLFGREGRVGLGVLSYPLNTLVQKWRYRAAVKKNQLNKNQLK